MSDWVEVVKLAFRPRYSFSIWVVALLVIFIDFPEKFKFQDFKNEFGKWIGLTALFFFVVWLVELFLYCSSELMNRYDKYCEQKKREAIFQSLDSSEKAILSTHLKKNVTTHNWPKDKSGVASLVHKGIIDQVETASSFGTPFDISPDAWRYMLKNKDQFLTLESKPTE